MIDRIFRRALRELVEDGRSVAPIAEPTSPHSNFGTAQLPTIEVRNWTAVCANIRARLLVNRVRGAHLDQALGMMLWNMCGEADLEEVRFYNSRAALFSDDGATLRGSWGSRMMYRREDSPIGAILRLLRNDPCTLRAVVPVYGAHDVAVSSRDVPCLIAIQFLVRDSQLHLSCHLRSLNPYWVWCYDHVFLTILLEFAGAILKLAPGTIAYSTSSLQVAQADLPLLRQALADREEASIEMPPMGAQTWAMLDRLARAKRELRGMLSRADWREYERRSAWNFLDPIENQWWRELLAALAAAYLARRGFTYQQLPVACPQWASALVAREAAAARS